MKNIGIVTFHKSPNYGAVLQSFALETFLNDVGYDARVINFKKTVVPKKRNSLKTKIKLFVRNILYFDRFIGYKKRCLKIKKFRNRHFKFTKEKYTINNLEPLNEQFDYFVTGSDQVFNLSFKYTDYYLLNFVSNSKKKISYAASFGYSKVPECYLDESKKLLTTFNKISVRETSGVEIVKKQLNRNECELVLDPTFLLSKEEWRKFENKKLKYENFVLYYAVANQTTLLQKAIKYAKNNNLLLVVLNNATEIKVPGAVNFYSAGIEDFLALYENARAVFTTSFHGLAFAINFNKDFYFELNKSKANANDRLITLIKHFDLSDRNIDNFTNVVKPIEWGKVNKKLETLKTHSKNFLINALN